jgi:hypothetical protein
MENSALIDIGLYLAYFLVAFAFLAAIVLPLIKSLDNPESLLHLGAGILGVLVIFGIGYALAGNEILPSYIRNDVETPGLSKLIGGSLITMYIMLIVAVGGILFTEVTKYFR